MAPPRRPPPDCRHRRRQHRPRRYLPTYRAPDFPVAGIFDVNADAAKQRAAHFAIDRVFTSLDEALATPGAVFDVAVPPGEIAAIIERMPKGSPVLIQKPMGRDLDDARRILRICRERHLTAAINFQLRFAPNMLALRDALRRGLLGDVADIEVRLNVNTPWGYWPFLKGLPPGRSAPTTPSTTSPGALALRRATRALRPRCPPSRARGLPRRPHDD